MKAIFKKTNPIILSVLFAIMLLFSGVCWFIVVSRDLAGKGNVFVCVFVSVISCSFGIFPSLYNYKAYLHIDDRKISGRFGFFKRVECEIGDVDFAVVEIDGVRLLLKDRKYYIRGIQNAYEVCAFLVPKLPFCFDGNKQDAISDLKKHEKNLKKNTILTFCVAGLPFVWILVAVFLTGARELSEFNSTDWIIFSIMCVLEISTVIAMFTFAMKTRQAHPIDLEKRIYGIRRTTIETTPLLKSPWNVKAVLTDVYFFHRITVYDRCIENNGDSFCYRTEVFDENFNLKFLWESEIFESPVPLEMFENLLDITDTYK